MEWFQNWINQIVLAVIICVLIELLLPQNTSKKYVKAVIGIYMLFSIFSPIVQWIEEKEWKEIFENQIFINYNETTQTSSTLGENGIARVYQRNLEENILQKLEELGYLAALIEVEITEDGSYEMESLMIQDIEKKDSLLEGMPITEGEKNQIKQVLSEDYAISEEQITLLGKER